MSKFGSAGMGKIAFFMLTCRLITGWRDEAKKTGTGNGGEFLFRRRMSTG
jgi:hypothetical protein